MLIVAMSALFLLLIFHRLVDLTGNLWMYIYIVAYSTSESVKSTFSCHLQRNLCINKYLQYLWDIRGKGEHSYLLLILSSSERSVHNFELFIWQLFNSIEQSKIYLIVVPSATAQQMKNIFYLVLWDYCLNLVYWYLFV